MLVSVPLLVAAFAVGRPEALPEPALPPSFDQTTAVQLATELARRYPDRSPGSEGARAAAGWVAARLGDYDLKAERRRFSVEVPGLGRRELENLVAVAPGRSPETIVVVAHRDNLGRSPGANDNASGTAALLELARTAGTAPRAHTLVFLSTDGGAYGGLGAAEFARHADETVKGLIGQAATVAAVVNLDSLAGGGRARIEFAADTARSPAAVLVASAEASVAAQTHTPPRRAAAVGQLVDLAFPFSLYEQAPFVAHGAPAVTLTTAGVRPAPPEGDTPERMSAAQLGALGRSAQALLTALDDAPELASGTASYVYAGSRLVRGWTIQCVLLAALLPFLAATLYLFARCRRRHIALGPALRSFRSRLGVWLWIGALFIVFAAAGVLPNGAARPINPDTAAAQRWPVLALAGLLALAAAGWLVAWPRLVPRRPATPAEERGGHLVAMLVLAIVALVVAAVNPFALVFVLPSLHAWLWLPHVADRDLPTRLGVYALGLAGPLLLLGSFAFRFDLGLDALWYVPALASVGYVPLPLVVAALVWAAGAAQAAALALGRYAPYPGPAERPVRGPIREALRRAILTRRRRKARAAVAESQAELRSLEQ